MEQQITVFNENDEQTGVTFIRRAKQLVKKERAEWLNEECDSIRLLSLEEETQDEFMTDESLLVLARNRVKERRKIVRHIGALAGTLFILSVLNPGASSGFIYYCLGVCSFWGAIIVKRTFLYFVPYMKNIGRAKRLQKDPVEAEYERLKRMNAL